MSARLSVPAAWVPELRCDKSALYRREQVSSRVDTGDRRFALQGVHLHVARPIKRQPEGADEIALALTGMREERVTRQRVTIDELDTFEMSAIRHEASDTTALEPNAAIREAGAHLEWHGQSCRR